MQVQTAAHLAAINPDDQVERRRSISTGAASFVFGDKVGRILERRVIANLKYDTVQAVK